MKKIELLDCTLRDGGYINNWNFGDKAIRDISEKIVQSGVEYFEIGFLRNQEYKPNYSLYTHNSNICDAIMPKRSSTKYAGMVDMEDPFDLERLGKRTNTNLDVIRVIFKKSKIDNALDYCKKIKELGYLVFIQPVGSDAYTDKELLELIEKVNMIKPYAFYIVDTLGVIKKSDFIRMAVIANHNLLEGISLGYHSHNNLQQAFGNAEALTELQTARNIILDACILGMGRGAGNLNLELFAEFLNENHGKSYQLTPMLEVIDEHLNTIHTNHFWGYSLPFYLSATNGCHPNYASFFAEKNTLTLKSFNEILRRIPESHKSVYSKEYAENIYQNYLENYIDDKDAILQLRNHFIKSKILILAPGKSLYLHHEKIQKWILENNPTIVSLNFIPENINTHFVFSCHMRRYLNIQNNTKVTKIITSNIKDTENYNYKLNFASFASDKPEIIDNSGIVFLKFLKSINITSVTIAGLDGYDTNVDKQYIHSGLEYNFSSEMMHKRNDLIGQELQAMNITMKISFLTPNIWHPNIGT